jgi:transposase
MDVGYIVKPFDGTMRVPEADCWLSHTRAVWRVENGQAVLVAYAIYRGPKNRYGKIPGVFGRSEFGIEIVLEPTNAEYRCFADRLLEIYHTSCRVQRDQRLSTAGRTEKVAMLEDEIFDLCVAMWVADLPPSEGPENDYRRLCNELMRLNLAKQLFTFVTAAPVQKPNGETMAISGTNNESERTLRSPAQARDTGRTNKTPTGARRQTVIVSVLESLRQYLSAFTLSNVIAEVGHWLETGQSCFARLAAKLGLTGGQPHADHASLLDRLIPVPGG